MIPRVAILGRPNVGKSTLFNRLVGRRVALVDKIPGVTRDRREGVANLGGLAFNAIDTAGFETGAAESLEGRAWRLTEAALDEADAALLMIDAITGLTPVDEEFAARVRASGTPVVVVANKCEGRTSDAGYYEAHSLGLGEPVPISAEHGLGLADLYEALAALLAGAGGNGQPPDEEGEAAPLRLTVAGRRNVGKSTLINRLIGKERVLTGAEPGLTRDAIVIDWEAGGQPIQLIDTAGLRPRPKATGKLERLAAADTRRGIAMAHVTVLMIDGQTPLERQDLTVANMAIELGRALVVAVNKWDLVSAREDALAALNDRLATSLPQVKGVPVVTFSALTGEGVESLMPAVLGAFETWSGRVGTGALNRWLEAVVERQPPPRAHGRAVRLRYVTQVGTRPPTFVVFANRPRDVPDSYVRFAMNDLRETFDLPGVPIRLNLRSSRRRKAAPAAGKRFPSLGGAGNSAATTR